MLCKHGPYDEARPRAKNRVILSAAKDPTRSDMTNTNVRASETGHTPRTFPTPHATLSVSARMTGIGAGA